MGRTGRSAVTAMAVGLALIAVPASAAGEVKVAAGGSHTCAIRIDNTIACWGSTTPSRAGATRPMTAPFPFPALRLGQRRRRPHVRPEDGRHARLLGPEHPVPPPHNVAPVGTFTAVDAGNTPGTTWSCAIGSNAHIVWGYNAFGRTNSPPGFFSAIGAGGTHGCAAPHRAAPAPGALTVREFRLAPRSGRGRSTI
jgi:hypothetical protein